MQLLVPWPRAGKTGQLSGCRRNHPGRPDARGGFGAAGGPARQGWEASLWTRFGGDAPATSRSGRQ